MEFTIKELRERRMLLSRLAPIKDPINDKLTYAVKKVMPRIETELRRKEEEHQIALEDAKIDNAAVDEKGILIMSEQDRSYKFTPEGMKLLNRQLAKLGNDFINKKVSVEPHYITSEASGYNRLDTLDDYDREQLEGLILEPRNSTTETTTETTTILEG